MDYLKVWTSFRETISTLNDSEKGRLFDAMLLYAETGEEPSEFKGNERFLWIVAKQDIDRTAQKCESLRANASKGGLAKSRNQQSLANDSKSCQTVANDSNDCQTEANPAHNIKKSNIKKSNDNISIDRRFTPPTQEQVAEYCRERGNSVDAQRFVDFYSSKGWKVGNQPMKDWKAAVRTWERDNRAKPTVPAQNYSQRQNTDATNDAMEQMRRMIRESREEAV